jgi:cyclic pyranopterin phosphate synthase
LRLSVTDACNLRCAYCRPAVGGESIHPGRASHDELFALVGRIHRQFPVAKLRLTGGEPLLAAGLQELVRGLRACLPAVRIGMTTNGLLLPQHAGDLYKAGVEALNISIDSLDSERCRDLTRGGRLARILDGLRAAVEAGFYGIKLNTVLLRSYNGDQVRDLVRLAARWGCEIRFIELMPMGEGAHLFDAEYLPADAVHAELTAAFEYLGPEADTGTARRHRLRVDGREVVVGYITTVSQPFCEGCNRYRLDVRGRLSSCLRDAVGQDLLNPLRDGREDVLAERIRAAVAGKTIPLGVWPERLMVGIGG